MAETRRLVWLASVVWPKLLFARASTGQRLMRLIFVVFGLLIALGIFSASSWFLRLCYQVEVIGPLLCQRLLDIVLLVLLSVLFLSNVVTALSSFFLAKDLDLLVTAPVPPRTFFAARFSEQLMHSSWMVLAFGVPVLLAFARIAGTGWTYPALIATVPPLIIIPAAVGVLLTLLLVSSLPAARVRDLVVALLFVAFIVLYLVLRLVEPERFINPEGFASMVNFIASFSAPSGAWLPSHWATALIASTFRGDASGGQLLLLAALWTAAGTAWVAASSFCRLIYAGAYSRSQQGRKVARLSRLWARLKGQPLPADGQIRAPERLGATADPLRLLGVLVPRGSLREFLLKDLKLLLRDASQWSQLVLLLALVFVYLYNFRHFRKIGESGMIGPLALFVVGIALSSFVTTAVSVRFAFPLVSMEGRMLWLLRAAPIPPGRILSAKLISTLPPLLVVGQVMSIVSCYILGVDLAMTALASAVSALTATSVAAIAIGVGAVLPDYQAESAAKVAASFGGLVCMTVAMIAAFALVACAAYPAYLLHYQRMVRPLRLALCGGGALAVTALSVWLPLRLGRRAIERYE